MRKEPALSDTIRAKEFIVVDDQGQERAKFGVDGTAVKLCMQGECGSHIGLALGDGNNASFEFCSGGRTIRLQIDRHRASLKLTDHADPVASCGLTIDSAGAWVYAEATPEVGVRLLSNRGGEGTSVWLAEKHTVDGEQAIQTRYIRPNLKEDCSGGWWR